MTRPLRLATRGSALAQAQARLAAGALRSIGVESDLVVVRTTGDRRSNVPVAEMEGQGWFTAELEQALLDGRADVAVHSAKDLPTELAAGLRVAACLPRGDPRDGVVARAPLLELPLPYRVGTSSVRRVAFLRGMRPGIEIVPMRGNVDTRLRKLDAGEVDALVLACAGLDRLGLGDRVVERLDPASFVPAPAQGAIALQAVDGAEAAAVVAAIDDGDTAVAVAAERAVLAGLGGGCLLPLGVWARIEADQLLVTGRLDGDEWTRVATGCGDRSRPGEVAAQMIESLKR